MILLTLSKKKIKYYITPDHWPLGLREERERSVNKHIRNSRAPLAPTELFNLKPNIIRGGDTVYSPGHSVSLEKCLR